MSALRVSSDPGWESLGDVRAAIATAYDYVREARRRLAAFGPAAGPSSFLQSAEADLVRALVAVGELEPQPFATLPGERPVPINRPTSALSRSA